MIIIIIIITIIINIIIIIIIIIITILRDRRREGHGARAISVRRRPPRQVPSPTRAPGLVVIKSDLSCPLTNYTL